MTEVTARSPATVSLPLGQILDVSAGEGCHGIVWRANKKLEIDSWLASNERAIVGPYRETRLFRIEATIGTLNYEIIEPGVTAALEATLPRATEIVVAQRIITHAINEGRTVMSQETDAALAKVDAAIAAKPAPIAGSFAASLRAMMDEARAGVQQARADGVKVVGEAVAELKTAAEATTRVAGTMAKSIKDEAASVMAELGQVSNMGPE